MSHLRLEMSPSTIVKQLAIATTGAVLLFGSTTLVAKAGTIQTDLADLAGPIIVVEWGISTNAPNNDDYVGSATSSPNNFNYITGFDAVGSIDIVLNVDNSGGTTEYIFYAVDLFNFSGSNWTGYKVELGFGTGANFVRSKPGDSLDFDAPVARVNPRPTCSAFTNLIQGRDFISWYAGNIPNGESFVDNFTFAVDVPDNLSLINPYGTSQFTLRQTPITR